MTQERDDGFPQGLSFAGEFRSAGGALEKPHAQRLLKCPDIARQGRLGEMQPVCGGRETPLLGNGQEATEVTQFDIHSLSV
ncbi:hypothetical protein HFP71_07260 [Streptomyces sp. ARC32]